MARRTSCDGAGDFEERRLEKRLFEQPTEVSRPALPIAPRQGGVKPVSRRQALPAPAGSGDLLFRRGGVSYRSGMKGDAGSHRFPPCAPPVDRTGGGPPERASSERRAGSHVSGRLNPPSARHCEGVINSRQRAALSTDGPDIPDVQLLPLWDAGDDFKRRQRDARPPYSSYRTLGDFAEIRRPFFETFRKTGVGHPVI